MKVSHRSNLSASGRRPKQRCSFRALVLFVAVVLMVTAVSVNVSTFGVGLGLKSTPRVEKKPSKKYPSWNIPKSFVLQGVRSADHRRDPDFIPEGTSVVPPKKLSNAELLRRYSNIDIVYTWVDGAELNYLFKKMNRMGYTGGVEWNPSPGGKSLYDVIEQGMPADSRDRDSGELKASVRSVIKYLPWHTGRIVLVSPGHIPWWLDPLSVFLSSSSPAMHQHDMDAVKEKNRFQKHRHIMNNIRELLSKRLHRGTPNSTTSSGHSSQIPSKRFTIVHQDAVVPYGRRLVFNTNGVEPFIYRLPMLTSVFIQFNDDYMVARETTIRTFLNEFGGPNLLLEPNVIAGGRLQSDTVGVAKQWLCGVYNTNSHICENIDSVVRCLRSSLEKWFTKMARCWKVT